MPTRRGAAVGTHQRGPATCLSAVHFRRDADLPDAPALLRLTGRGTQVGPGLGAANPREEPARRA